MLRALVTCLFLVTGWGALQPAGAQVECVFEQSIYSRVLPEDPEIEAYGRISAGRSYSFVGIPSASMIVSGFLDYALERVRDELVYAYAEKLRNYLDDDSHLLHHVAPRTREALTHLDVVGYRLVFSGLRRAAIEDLRGLPARLSDPRSLDKADVTVKDQASLEILHVAATLVNEIVAGSDPVVALSELRKLQEDSLRSDSLRALLVPLGGLACEYIASGDSLARVRDITTFAEVYRRAFLGSLSDTGLYPGLAGVTPPRPSLAEIDSLVGVLQVIRNHAEAGRDESERTDEIADSQLRLLREVERGLRESRTLFSVGGRDADRFEYALGEARRLYAAWLAEDYAGALFGTLSLTRSYGGFELSAYDARYLVLAAALADADEPGEVSQALAAAAEPLGSYRTKRRTWTIGINAYPGAALAWEWDRDQDLDEFLAFVLPVGVEFGLPWMNLSLLVPIVDLGHPLTGYLRDDEDTDIGYEQLLAPGLGVTKGWEAYPFSAGLLFQRTNDLIEDPDGRSRDSSRATAFLAFDLPLFFFRTGSP